MKRNFLFLIVILSVLITGCKDSDDGSNAGKISADCLITGNIITMDEDNPYAEAVVVKDGIVEFVGSHKDAEKYCDSKTVVLDYGKNTVYPGFLEGHVHGLEVANRSLQLDLSGLDEDPKTTMQDFLSCISEYVHENPGQDLYKGAGWTVRDNVQPTAAMLDTICNTAPMILSSVDGHSMWINSVAIEKYHVSDPANIKKYGTDCIRVDNITGYPTGYISEAAMDLVRPALALTKEEYMNGLLKWQEMAFSYGITGVLEAALPVSGSAIQEAYLDLVKSGKWKLRSYAVEAIQHATPDSAFYGDLKLIKDHTQQYNTEYFKVYGIKIFIDGVVEAHTAWLLEPYNDDPSYYGLKAFPDVDRIAEAVSYANQNGMIAHFHAIGDAAVRTAVNGIVKSQNETGLKDNRNTIAHLQIVQPEEIVKIGANDIIPVVAPLWVPIEPGYFEHEEAYLGQRARKQYPIKSFFDQGCNVTFHTDYPVSPNISMPQTIYCAVKRTSEQYGEAGVLNIDEAVTRQQALEAITVNIAYQLKEENRLGKIKKGFVANMSVCSADFLKDEMSAIFNASTVATIVDGNVVYSQK